MNITVFTIIVMTFVTIQVKAVTKERLASLGSLSATYDSVINEILDHVNKCTIQVQPLHELNN